MRTIAFGVMQFLFWSAFYVMQGRLQDERMALAAFAVTVVVSLVATAIYMAKRQ